MKLQVQSIHFTADVKLLDFLQKKLDKLETFNDSIIDGEVFLKLDTNDAKGNKVVNIKLNIPGNSIVVKEQRSTFEEAIDVSYDILKNQLSKLKEKSVAH